MAKGIKLCSCGATCGCRSLSCPTCGKSFGIVSKAKVTVPKPPKKKKNGEKVDWHTLQQNDIIKVVGGPFWPLTSGDRIPLGYKGKFLVHSLSDSGIHAYPYNNRKESGHCHIYMGDVRRSVSGTILRPHKLRKFGVHIP